MDYTLMIVVRAGGIDGAALTSQLKSYASRGLADRAAEAITKQGIDSGTDVRVIKLYE